MRGALRSLSSPRDLWLVIRMAAWAPLLPLLKFLLPLPRLVRLAAAKPRRGDRDEARERRIARLAAVLYRSRGVGMRDNCLERSLVTYRFLGRANARPRLVVGMRAAETDVVGHVWVLVDGNAVHDPPEEVAQMTTMMSFDETGRLEA
jgi:hypothetical protein